jgi:transposase
VLLLPPSVRILLAAEPVDLRKSIDGLCAIVRSSWNEDLYVGHLFVFLSRRGDRVKILAWDNGGFVLTYKRLEQGRFRKPKFQDGVLGAQLDGTQLAMLLDGIDLSHVRRPKKWAPEAAAENGRPAGTLIYSSRWQRSLKTRRIDANGASGPRRSRQRTKSFGQR